MVYSLTYRRPAHVDSARASVMGDEKPKSLGEGSIDSQGSGPAFGIPDALSFDRIIAGGTCPVGILPSAWPKTNDRPRALAPFICFNGA